MDKNKIATNTYEKIGDMYAKQYFNDYSDHPYIDKFLKFLRGKKVLDVGSGPGQFSKYMINKGFQVIGVDYTQKMIDIAKNKVPEGTFETMDMRNLNFKPESFDGILVAYSLIHIPTEEIAKTLKGFYKVLKQDGYIALITQKGESDKITNEPFMPTEKMFFNLFTKEKLYDFLTDANFEIVFQLEADSLDPNSVGEKVIYTIVKKA